MNKLLYYFKRIFIRLKFTLKLKEIYHQNNNLEQICKKCSNTTKFDFNVSDELWNRVTNNYNYVLCLNCFVNEASKRNIELNINNFRLFIIQ